MVLNLILTLAQRIVEARPLLDEHRGQVKRRGAQQQEMLHATGSFRRRQVRKRAGPIDCGVYREYGEKRDGRRRAEHSKADGSPHHERHGSIETGFEDGPLGVGFECQGQGDQQSNAECAASRNRAALKVAGFGGRSTQ